VRTLYSKMLDRMSLAVLDCCLFQKTNNGSIYLITRINVPIRHRGQGHGSDLLDTALEDADAIGSSLLLEIHPSGSEMNYDKLERWYRSRGFRRSKKYDGFFIRKPQ